MLISQDEALQNTDRLTKNLDPTGQELDNAISVLQSRKDEWANHAIIARLALLDQLIKDWALLMSQMVVASAKAKGGDESGPIAAEEWLLGPWALMKYLRSLRYALSNIEKHGYPRIPGPVTTRPDGQVVAQVFPQTAYDKVFFSKTTIEVWMQPGITAQELYESQAWAYTNNNHKGQVALILGAGNISSMGPMDIAHKLFVEGQVAFFKVHPVNSYLGPIIETGFRTLIEKGFLRVTHGGADTGSYLCNHPGIDSIYMVGSDKTFEAIVFGAGPELQERKLKNEPLIDKPVAAELGNVSPYIIVPGRWNERDLAYHADLLATCIANNASCNCVTPRVLVMHKQWKLRDAFLDELRKLLAKVPLRTAYYPGAHERYDRFLQAHTKAEQVGNPSPGELPWTLIRDVDPSNSGDICFTTEAFCSVLALASIEAESITEYLEKAVEFCNRDLWGTLAASVIVHPQTLKDSQVATGFDRALANLKYGTIAINYLASLAYCVGQSPWGAFPGHSLSNIQSGNAASLNALMLANTQKTIVRAPFRILPTPPWFVTQSKKTGPVFRKLAEFEAFPSPWKVPGIMMAVMKP